MAPVRNLVVKEVVDVVLIVWDEPMFAQNYTKIKYGITVSGSGLSILTNNDISDLQYTVSRDMLSVCKVYSFIVSAYEDIIQSAPISVSYEYSGSKHKGKFIVYSLCKVFFFLKRYQYLCNGLSHDV